MRWVGNGVRAAVENLRLAHVFEPMTEIEILRKQLADANAEIQTLTMRLRNAEILYKRELRKSEAQEAGETKPKDN